MFKFVGITSNESTFQIFNTSKVIEHPVLGNKETVKVGAVGEYL